MIRFVILCLGISLLAITPGLAQKKKQQNKEKESAQPKRPVTATPVEQIKIAKGFKVELLHTVPKEKEGSWVSMCLDPKGRLIVCDQYGGLFRVTPPAVGGKAADTKVEPLKVEIGQAQGLLWAFDSLYVMVNGNKPRPSGLYRVQDSDGDGELDKVTQLRELAGGGGEHGPHAILLSPDGKSLYCVCGNQTKLTKFADSRVPPIWGEDHLLPRMPDGRGFMAGVMGPGGAIYKVDPDGKNWEIISVGYRNQYDAAFNRHGDLFTYDADMEWDVNTPWYRPTRVCLSASGAEFGWRNGTGKWPAYYPDSLPSIIDIGPGSPTGVTFGYGGKFPAKYQEAFFICDWSYGKMYAVHLTPYQSAYKAEMEEFMSANPLPLTDLVVSASDGAMYFAIGGRRAQSGLYRVTYVGTESTAPSKGDETGAEMRAVRRKLEALHTKKDAGAVQAAWPYLSHPDRYLRFAARVAIEHQDPGLWQAKALSEADPIASTHALIALVRVSASDPFHRAKDAPPVDPKLKADILAALDKIVWEKLSPAQQVDLLRAYSLAFNRMGQPEHAYRQRAITRFDQHFPARDRFVNSELCQILVYLQAPSVAAKAIGQLEVAPTQEEQIDYVKSLRMLQTGWTPELRQRYFAWFIKGTAYKGGASFANFIANIKKEAVARLSDDDRVALKSILEAQPKQQPVTPIVQRPFVKKWTLDELAPIVESGLKKRDFDRGRQLFAQGQCYSCHRFNNEGGAQGPDLTGVSGRYSVRDLLESVIDPNKEISDQYQAVVFTLDTGKTVTGRIVNLSGDNMSVLTDMLNPDGMTNVDRRRVESMETSKISMMPAGLLDSFKQDEILDLVAFLLSRGDRTAKMFE